MNKILDEVLIKDFKIVHGDSFEELKKMPDNSIKLFFMSPPYAEQRKKQYGGVSSEDYVEWFKPLAVEMKRVLKEDGSIVILIRENAKDGERSLYVYDLVIALKREVGLRFVDDYKWVKTNSVPGKWSTRFRDSHETLYHFTKSPKFTMNQDDVKVPIGDWASSRLKNLSENDKKRTSSATGSGFGRKIENWVGKETVYPSNVLTGACVSFNKDHPATHPQFLSDFFVKLFTNPGDIVCDPFTGSGTTGVSAIEHSRKFLGFEIKEKFAELAQSNLEKSRNKKIESQGNLLDLFLV